jgi:hypothetical protein
MKNDGQALNADLRLRVAVDSLAMEWTPSPGGHVLRKRVHLAGPAEAGQVTSVVRYQPGARFPAHDHPGGEEILVLEGIFSDEHGDWPAGTYLLNPEGFRHGPFSREGCTLFVKLRQFPGTDRRHVAIQTGDLPWSPADRPGTRIKPLYQQAPYTDRTRLERWEAPGQVGQIDFAAGAELFVLDGGFADDYGSYQRHSWLRIPAGGSLRPRGTEPCELYIKEGGFTYLQHD